VAELLASPLWRNLESPGTVERREQVNQVCGVDPLEVVEDVVVGWVRPRFGLDSVVFFLKADVPLEAAHTCIQQVLEFEGRGVRIVDVANLPALAGEQGDSRLVWLGGGWIVLGTEESARTIAQASRERPVVEGPWMLPTEDAPEALQNGQIRVRVRVPAEFSDSSLLAHGFTGGVGRRVVGLMESAEGTLRLDDERELRWAFDIQPRGDEGASILRAGLEGWRLAVRTLGGDGPLGEAMASLSAQERAGGVFVEGQLRYETLLGFLPVGDASP